MSREIVDAGFSFSDTTTIRIQTAAFDPGAETNAFIAAHPGAGATVTFTGLVRSTPDAPVETLTLECYPDLAANEITRLATEATARFGLSGTTIIHRYGTLRPAEPIVQVMTAAPHRAAAFAAAEFLMDYLKTDAPFWKQEASATGTHWVQSRSEDEAAKTRWQK
ncbi:MAG TPA: molybdenum cofactor biosynthesis protein MoaE [Devosia sp.]|nr:molybdenum cofactor biosynthesis protein MoaE [Devosia sp.]